MPRCSLFVRFVATRFSHSASRAAGRQRGPTEERRADCVHPAPTVMAGLVPLLSGFIPADGSRGVDISGFPTVRASRDTDFGSPASPRFPRSSSPAVMAGLVPAIHVSRHRGARREGTGRRPHVDARNESGHDDTGGGGGRPHRPRVSPAVTPDLFRGPERPSRRLSTWPWTPEQVRGDSVGERDDATSRGWRSASGGCPPASRGWVSAGRSASGSRARGLPRTTGRRTRSAGSSSAWPTSRPGRSARSCRSAR